MVRYNPLTHWETFSTISPTQGIENWIVALLGTDATPEIELSKANVAQNSLRERYTKANAAIKRQCVRIQSESVCCQKRKCTRMLCKAMECKWARMESKSERCQQCARMLCKCHNATVCGNAIQEGCCHKITVQDWGMHQWFKNGVVGDHKLSVFSRFKIVMKFWIVV